MPSSRLAALVFDFDGVIADSEPIHFTAFRDVLASIDIALSEAEYYERYLGYDDDGAFRAVGADHGRSLGEAEIARLIERKGEVLLEQLRGPHVVFAGARACLERFAGVVPVAIASGARREEIELVLGAHDLARYVSVIVAAGETPRSKPAPDPYVRATLLLMPLARHNVSIAPSSCVAVEDSRWGLASARAAGLRTVALTTSYDRDALGDADVVIDGLDELTLSMADALVV